MKTEKNILIAFILNITFAIIELFGGLLTSSIAIISDSIHDMGDALSIGVSYFLEKKSKQQPDQKYTYGYTRYSLLGATITTSILLVGSILVIINAIKRILNPVQINYNGMIIIALFGVIINFLAAYFTRKGNSLNQKSVNLHMLEDVLGWVIVLLGAIIMKITSILILDPILSIIVAIFILTNALKNLKTIIDLILEKIPDNISIEEVKKQLLSIPNIEDVHHIHIWSIDGYNNYATMHVITTKIDSKIKEQIREKLKKYNIHHVTIELETKEEKCGDINCHVDATSNHNNHAHHHH